MLGGDQDYNHKKDMPPIASLIFAMRREKNEKIQKYNFEQKTIKENKDMVKHQNMVLLAPLKHKENIIFSLIP